MIYLYISGFRFYRSRSYINALVLCKSAFFARLQWQSAQDNALLSIVHCTQVSQNSLSLSETLLGDCNFSSLYVRWSDPQITVAVYTRQQTPSHLVCFWVDQNSRSFGDILGQCNSAPAGFAEFGTVALNLSSVLGNTSSQYCPHLSLSEQSNFIWR